MVGANASPIHNGGYSVMMDNLRRIGLGIICACSCIAGIAAAAPFDMTGVWTLQSMTFVDEATGTISREFGDHPKGYAIFAPGGYMSVVINAEGRQPIPAGADNVTEPKAKLFSTMTSHAGPYQLSNGKLTHQVEVAHDPAMIGHDLIRFVRVLDNDHMESTTPVRDAGGGRRVKVVLVWERKT